MLANGPDLHAKYKAQPKASSRQGLGDLQVLCQNTVAADLVGVYEKVPCYDQLLHLHTVVWRGVGVLALGSVQFP